MDITPSVSSDIKLITGYSNTGFIINDQKFESNIILSNNFVANTDENFYENGELLVENLLLAYQVLISQSKLDPQNKAIFLLGTGSKHTIISPDILKKFKSQGITLEPMTTSAACRTYNVLVSEDRHVLALILTNVISA